MLKDKSVKIKKLKSGQKRARAISENEIQKASDVLENEPYRKISVTEFDILDLDVSGVTEGFKVAKSLLKSVPGSALDTMFSGRQELKKVDGRIFIN